MDMSIKEKLRMARVLTRSDRKLTVSPLRCRDRRLVHRPPWGRLTRRLSRRVFLKYVGREPKDTYFVWSTKGLEPDIFFNILYFTLAQLILGFVMIEVDKLLGTLREFYSSRS